MKYTQRFPFRPKSKERPRMSRTGYAYTPKATKKYEALVANTYNGPKFPDGPISVTLKFNPKYIELTISDLKSKSISPLRGDIDNYAKSILDALNTIAYEDDKQIITLRLEKT